MEFRELRRFKQKMTDDVAFSLLEKEKRAVLAVNGDNGYPYAIPVDYHYDRATGKILIHGAKAGHKYDSIARDDRVCFTVYGNEQSVDGDWEPQLDSVVVFGRCRLVDDEQETAELAKKVGLKYYPTEESVDNIIEETLSRIQIYEITIEHISCKRIHER